MIDGVEGLSGDERGVLLGLFAGGAEMGQAAAAAERLVGPVQSRCLAAARALAQLPAAEREAELGALGASVGAAVPEGLAEVHPDWIRRTLAGERSTSPLVRRIVLAGLAPMCGDDARGPSLEEIDQRGAELVGLALVGAPAQAVARAAASVGEPLARVVLAGALGGSVPARDAARGLVADVPAGEARRGLARAVGLRALAGELRARSPAARVAVAQRLPPAVGDVLLALAASAGEA